MSYKVLCSDLDGTLLGAKGALTIPTIDAIKSIKEQLDVILVSARMPQSMTYIQNQLGILNQPIICYNGGLVIKNNKIISSLTIPIAAVEKIYQLATKHHVKLGLYHNTEWYAEEITARIEKEIRNTNTSPIIKPIAMVIDDWKAKGISAHKIMLMGTKESADALTPELTIEFKNLLHLYRSNDTLIEVADIKVSKLKAITQLIANDPNINLSNVIAFGDNYNDIEMLKGVGHGVAVANGRAKAIAVADALAPKNTEDGVASYLTTMFR